MENRFAQHPLIDNRTGRIAGLDVRMESDGTFLFVPSAKSGKWVTLSKTPEMKREAFLEFSRIRAEAALKHAGGGCDSFDDAFMEELLAFAAEHGPLFGFAGLSKERPEIREPITDWIAAQQVMERALKAEVFSRGGEVDAAAIDECFWVEFYADDEFFSWNYFFDTGVAPSNLYRSCLKGSSHESYTTDDGSILSSLWLDGQKNPFPDEVMDNGHMVAMLSTGFPTEIFGPVQGRGQTSRPLSFVRGIKEIEAEVGSLLKIVAGKHTGGISLDFRNPMSTGEKEDVAYGIVCTSYLSYMWHELAQAYTRRSFRVCANPKCENIISINDETNSNKRFCCEHCRVQANNAKLSAQNTRAREAFYAYKPYAEIYEEAFGKAFSFKDPERAKLCRRLDRWIEGQFSKSAEGKSALRQGAARQ